MQRLCSMIVDIAGVVLFPENQGKDCPGNSLHHDAFGNVIDRCCDECDYMMCCFGVQERLCPRNPAATS